MNSMISQPAGAIGAIVLAALADGTSVTTAMVVGGVLCAIAAPLYIPSFRAEKRRATRKAESGTGAVSAPTLGPGMAPLDRGVGVESETGVPTEVSDSRV
jgi:hypothetical protein